jgi:hypothetical protein
LRWLAREAERVKDNGRQRRIFGLRTDHDFLSVRRKTQLAVKCNHRALPKGGPELRRLAPGRFRGRSGAPMAGWLRHALQLCRRDTEMALH